MVCHSSRTQGSDVCLLDVIVPLSLWMGRHVPLDYFPLDLCHVEVLQCDGVCIGIPYAGVLRPGRCLPLQFRERFTALSCVNFVVI